MIGETGKGKRRRRLDDSERGEGGRGIVGRTDGRTAKRGGGGEGSCLGWMMTLDAFPRP